jgi:hypothetical protein
MGTECGDKKCQQKAEDTHEEVFNKPSGLKERMMKVERKKIPWIALVWIVPVIITVSGTIFGFMYTSYASNEGKQDTKIEKIEGENSYQKIEIAVLKDRTQNILTAQNETNELLKQLIEQNTETKKDKKDN